MLVLLYGRLISICFLGELTY